MSLLEQDPLRLQRVRAGVCLSGDRCGILNFCLLAAVRDHEKPTEHYQAPQALKLKPDHQPHHIQQHPDSEIPLSTTNGSVSGQTCPLLKRD